jgi:DNA topoisomerase-1
VNGVDVLVESVAPSRLPARAPESKPMSSTAALAKRLGLRLVASDALTIRRRRCGRGFAYYTTDGQRIRNRTEVRRLSALAVPPAYAEVLYADDPSAHLQAVGRDAAGRLQYRYHPQWEKVREARKARRLTRLVEALPRIRRSVARHLGAQKPTHELALAAVIELVARSAIRSGGENYARMHGTRGAATLLKSNVTIAGETVTLSFRSKGGKEVHKEFSAPRLCTAIDVVRRLPGRRLFQYRDDDGAVRAVQARQVNGFLRSLAGVSISLKDFRNLCASASALGALARTLPATSARQRRKQVLEAVRVVAAELHNTPTICRKSYIHDAVVSAFENGVLENFAATLRSCRSQARKEQFLAEVVAAAAL